VLIVSECLNAPPTDVHSCRTRTRARNVELRSNSDNERDNARALRYRTGRHLAIEPQSALPEPLFPAFAATFRPSAAH
jgi:hypothetical protein